METMKGRVSADLETIQANLLAANNTPTIKEEAPPEEPKPQQNVAQISKLAELEQLVRSKFSNIREDQNAMRE
jgi:hypothetical protein